MHRKAKEPAAIVAKFVPRFWELDADKRQTRLRLIRTLLAQHITQLSVELFGRCGGQEGRSRR